MHPLSLAGATVQNQKSKIDRPYAVRALIVQDQEILFIHHQNPALFDKWTFPGGRLDPDETDPVGALLYIAKWTRNYR